MTTLITAVSLWTHREKHDDIVSVLVVFLLYSLEVSENDIASFLSAYREHCEVSANLTHCVTSGTLSHTYVFFYPSPQAILDVVLHLQFQMVDQLWQNFWSMTER